MGPILRPVQAHLTAAGNKLVFLWRVLRNMAFYLEGKWSQ
jgi:hypothetical protein